VKKSRAIEQRADCPQTDWADSTLGRPRQARLTHSQLLLLLLLPMMKKKNTECDTLSGPTKA
jgi:hypothetical protein